MAEQYILLNATPKLVKPFLKSMKCKITPVFHDTVGWSDTSRAAYGNIMGQGDGGVVNRQNLPPHFYIEIEARQDTTGVYSGDGDLYRSLSRGVVDGFLKGLTAGKTAWGEGRNAESLIAEIGRGNVSIGIYHFSGKEVGKPERDTVDGYAKKA